MKILAVTDLHDKRSMLVQILDQAGPADVVLLGGDITNFGNPNDAERLVRSARASGAQVLAVAGNCDSAEIEKRLVELGVSLFQRGIIIGGVGIHGLSGMPPWLKPMYHFSEEELADHLRVGFAQIAGSAQHVIMSHPPPRCEHLDRTHRGRNVGSTALRAFIDQHQPLLVLCGHIHEGRGIERIGRTTVVNCGAAAEGCYALADVGLQLAVELCQV